jgi:hypothetical protein
MMQLFDLSFHTDPATLLGTVFGNNYDSATPRRDASFPQEVHAYHFAWLNPLLWTPLQIHGPTGRYTVENRAGAPCETLLNFAMCRTLPHHLWCGKNK